MYSAVYLTNQVGLKNEWKYLVGRDAFSKDSPKSNQPQRNIGKAPGRASRELYS
jgi:hypothetical protein